MSGQTQWITWEQAAEIVGCTVSTIDWHKRSGRIGSRKGQHPSLDRASVEQFAVWWRERESGHASRRPGARSRMDPAVWASAREAATLLDVSLNHVGWLSEHGQLSAEIHHGRRWVTRDSLRALRDERGKWMTYTEAALAARCSPGTISRAVRSGDIESRNGPTSLPSLRRSSVETFAKAFRQKQRDAVARRSERPASAPPDDEHVWLDVTTTALLMGVSPVRVLQLVAADRLPHERRRRRVWFRRDLIEQTAAARVRRDG